MSIQCTPTMLSNDTLGPRFYCARPLFSSRGKKKAAGLMTGTSRGGTNFI